MFNGQVLYDRSMIVRIDKGGPDQEKLKLPSEFELKIIFFQLKCEKQMQHLSINRQKININYCSKYPYF